jgi:putative endonuclease
VFGVPWTYIVECRDGSYYVGSTYDIERRVSEHNLGFGAAYARPRRRRPVKLVWSAEFDRMDQAYWYEKQIQGWGREKRQADRRQVGGSAEARAEAVHR